MAGDESGLGGHRRHHKAEADSPEQAEQHVLNYLAACLEQVLKCAHTFWRSFVAADALDDGQE